MIDRLLRPAFLLTEHSQRHMYKPEQGLLKGRVSIFETPRAN
jgi:hypothetical protein